MKSTNQPKENIAWAAGFFEGEGCFYAHKSKPRLDGTTYIRVDASLAQKDRSLLYKFRDIIGFGIICNEDRSGCGYWKTSKKNDAKKLFELLKPWLSDRRKNKYKEIENFAKQTYRPLGSHMKFRITKVCPKGHKRNGVDKRGRRYCVECQREANKNYYWRNKSL